jgi:hypothetical protein
MNGDASATVSAATWRVRVSAAACRIRIRWLPRFASADDCASLGEAMGCALTVAIDRHRGDTSQFAGFADVRRQRRGTGENANGQECESETSN